MIQADGGNTSVRVKTDARCEWTASTSESWIKVSTTRGSGDAEIGYSVDRNAGTEREGTVRVASEIHRVEQKGAKSSGVSLKGRVSNLSGACPDLGFTADSRQVVTDSTARFTGGPCRDLRSGIEVEIEGELRGRGVVYATRIETKKND
jgi:hypothetical protein